MGIATRLIASIPQRDNMKKMLLTLSLAMVGSAAVAAPASIVEVSATGNGKPFGNAPALIVDGVTPDEVIT